MALGKFCDFRLTSDEKKYIIYAKIKNEEK